jgi:dihydrolipoamide dehydrogenase
VSETIEIRVPDIGDFSDVEIIEVHVSAGDSVKAEDPLITLESDKASMEVPSPREGTVEKVLVSVGDRVSEGSPVVTLSGAISGASDAGTGEGPPQEKPGGSQRAATPTAAEFGGDADESAELVVIGAGPGGYTAAFRAADLGLDVVLVERYPTLGGVCLNVGCIPSKALLHAAKVIEDADSMSAHGIVFGRPEIDLDNLRGWKDGIVGRLTKGLAGLASGRKVRVLEGSAAFLSANHIEVVGKEGRKVVAFRQCIIAAGSRPFMLPNMPEDPRIIDSTGALELDELPERMLVVGGGIIGLEMACVYDALGVEVSVVELTPTLMPGCDRDLVRPLQKRVEKRYQNVWLGIRVSKMESMKDGIRVTFEGENAPEPQIFGKVLVAVGRTPNGTEIGADRAGVEVDDRGFIRVDRQMRTNVEHIYAIGDIVGQPMLAHKASNEGKVAAEVAAGMKSAFDARVIPSVAYTDPEIAWVGLTETDARDGDVAYEIGKFPWAASGRSLALGRDEGFTKLLFDPETHRILGAGIVGTSAGDLIAEAGLAIEMGADAADIGLTIHPHPTLAETVAMAAEAFEGTLTELYLPKRKKKA